MGIELQNIGKTFGRFKALDGVSLSVPEGELTALLGPSGSGKTTLLRIIAGLEMPDLDPHTVIRFHGQEAADRAIGERRVGFVFQHYALFRHMTVFENIAFGLRAKPRRRRPAREKIRERVDELLRLIQLEGIEHRYPSQLSGGQRQRVALARALAIEPKVLLLDEPFGALDAKVRQDLRRWLRKLHDEIRITSVFVTHDQEEALEVADRIVIMNRGRIEQIGTPEQVFHHPANQFVMEFLGNVNLFHGRVEDGRAILESAGEDGRLFVRPFDLQIHARPEGPSSIGARIDRIRAAGPLVKIDLTDDSGGALYVELSHEQFRRNPLERGARVHLVPRQIRTFMDPGAGI